MYISFGAATAKAGVVPSGSCVVIEKALDVTFDALSCAYIVKLNVVAVEPVYVPNLSSFSI